jgi:hypothetical protein
MAEQTLDDARDVIWHLVEAIQTESGLPYRDDGLCICEFKNEEHSYGCKYLRRAIAEALVFAGSARKFIETKEGEVFEADMRVTEMMAAVDIREREAIERINSAWKSSMSSLEEVKQWLDDWEKARQKKELL